MIVSRLLESGWLHAPYIKLYICMNYLILSLIVMVIDYSTSSQVFLWIIIMILCFYQLLYFIANCWHLTEYLRESWTYTHLLVHGIILDRSWKIVNPWTSNVLPIYVFTVRQKSGLSANTDLPYKFINWRYAKIVQ